MPEMPSMPAFANPFGGPLELQRGDVRFTDADGDLITLRPKPAGRVDFYVGNDLKLANAGLHRNGNVLELTGTLSKGTPLSFLGFNLEETVTEGTQPSDPADVDKAMALVS